MVYGAKPRLWQAGLLLASFDLLSGNARGANSATADHATIATLGGKSIFSRPTAAGGNDDKALRSGFAGAPADHSRLGRERPASAGAELDTSRDSGAATLRGRAGSRRRLVGTRRRRDVEECRGRQELTFALKSPQALAIRTREVQ